MTISFFGYIPHRNNPYFTMATTTKNTRSSDDASSSVDDDSSSSSSSKSDLEVDEPDDDADSSSSPAATGASNNVPIISQQQQQQQQQAAPVHLSKSWSVLKSHVPLYTGGKISFLTDTTETGQSSLLLPMDGDLARVQNGTALATLRGDSVQDDDDDGVDANAITAYAVSSNNTTNTNFILTCSRNSILCQYDATTFARTRTWCKSGHTLPVTALEIHSSNAFCATASVDGSVRVWDVRGAYCTHVYKATDRVSCCQWHPTQLILAVGRSNGSIVIYTLTEKEESSRVVLNDHVSAVTCIEWIDHKNLLVTAGRDAVLNLWKISEKRTMNKGETTTKLTYERIHTLPIYEQVEGMVVLPHYYYQTNKLLVVATAGSKGKVRLWNIAPSETSEVLSFQLLAQQADSEAFGEARGGYTGMRLVPTDRNNSKEQLLVADAEHNLSFLSLSDNSAQELLKTDRTIIGHNDDILDLKVIPTIQSNLDSTTQRIVVATNSSKVRIFSLNDFSCQVLDRHTATVLCVDVSPCGQYVATCGKDKHMRVWNLKNNSCVGLAEGHTEAIGATALSRKVSSYKVTGKAATNGAGSFAVTVSMDRTLKRWNLPGASILDELASDNKCVSLLAFASVRAHEKDINIVSVAPNDSLIATGSQDKTVKLWNASDLSLQATLKGHRRGVWDCQFSPFDRVLATGSGDRTIKLWSLSDGYSCLRSVVKVLYSLYACLLVS
jgi:U3 small nucleolar RNA-associated protein 13